MSGDGKVLIVKMSSMGDIIHTLPALTDALAALPGVRFDWVVEEAFMEIPGWHPAVDRVIPVALRRWRGRPLSTSARAEWRAARSEIRRREYDKVIDAQGLLKSALVTRLARGRRCGMDRRSAREGLSALTCDSTFAIPRAMHAVERTRLLFSRALEYPRPEAPGDFGLDKLTGSRPRFTADTPVAGRPCVWLLHGTTRRDKTWPQAHWQALARELITAGYDIALTWGNTEERERAQAIVAACTRESGAGLAQLVPKSGLGSLAAGLSRAAAAVAVDTGLGHLAAALGVPVVSLYGPTDPGLIGAYGPGQVHLVAAPVGAAAPVSGIDPPTVWQALSGLLAPGRTRVSGGMST